LQSIDTPFFLFVEVLILKTVVFFSVNHIIYSQFMAQSALANNGCSVGFLCGAGTRMALWFYIMMRLLLQKGPLGATIPAGGNDQSTKMC
jgi:hypothetical protein